MSPFDNALLEELPAVRDAETASKTGPSDRLLPLDGHAVAQLKFKVMLRCRLGMENEGIIFRCLQFPEFTINEFPVDRRQLRSQRLKKMYVGDQEFRWGDFAGVASAINRFRGHDGTNERSGAGPAGGEAPEGGRAGEA